jgi:hypothetical protein
MTLSAASDEALQADPGDSGGQGHIRAVAASVALHGALLAIVLLLLPPFGMQGVNGDEQIVPVDVVTAGIDPQETAPADPGPRETGDASPVNPSSAAAVANSEQGDLPNDALQAKLQALATLRQPDAARSDDRQSAAPSLTVTTDDAAPGRLNALRDFIRLQVVRHWSLDLAALAQNDFVVPVRVQIGSDGTVLKAEIVDTARTSDPVYRVVATSARNAVLMASPLTLPAGHYARTMQLVLSLDPRETLH